MFDELFGLENAHEDIKGVDAELLTTIRDEMMMGLVRGLLEEHNVPYMLKERGAGSAMRLMTGFSMYGTDVFVPTESIEFARDLIEGLVTNTADVPEEETVEEAPKEMPAEEPVVPVVPVEAASAVTEVEPEPQPEPEPEPYGIEIVTVVWPENRNNMKRLYRYDPDGHKRSVGDLVMVPTRDVHSGKEIVREAEVVKANHRVAPEEITFRLKKIYSVGGGETFVLNKEEA